jgi:hypothetical protein
MKRVIGFVLALTPFWLTAVSSWLAGGFSHWAISVFVIGLTLATAFFGVHLMVSANR